MKVVIPGGTRQVGAILNRAFAAVGHEVVVLTRWPSPDGHVAWDGETMGARAGVIDGVPVGLPATRWMAELGALAIRSETELLLKSRRVIPGRLLAAGFEFSYSEWAQAAGDLVRRART